MGKGNIRAYEKRKKALIKKGLTPLEYEKRIKQIAKKERV